MKRVAMASVAFYRRRGDGPVTNARPAKRPGDAVAFGPNMMLTGQCLHRQSMGHASMRSFWRGESRTDAGSDRAAPCARLPQVIPTPG